MELMTMVEVCEMTKLSRQTIDRLRRQGGFPLPINLAERSPRWVRAEVEDWVVSKAERADD